MSCDGGSFTIVPDIRSCCLLDGERAFTVETMETVRQCKQCVGKCIIISYSDLTQSNLFNRNVFDCVAIVTLIN